ncbi:MAG TPA: hypothetical protein VMF91_06155 [Bryobacteraceae bacterium]|nr:hypothetical protein [Bryobacteraceae bacterium]
MSTEAQVRANQENAQHSTGPNTEAGKAASCLNNFRHGLTGNSFTVLDFEDQDEFDALLCGLRAEHQPSTLTETLLVQKMAQSYWLSKRALYLQDQCCTDRAHRASAARCAQSNEELTLEQQEKHLALFIRYQTTNDRAFHRCLADLLKLKAEKRKAEIGFESQQHKKAQESRREAAEKRKQDHHKLDMLLAEAKLNHQELLNCELSFEVTGAPLAPARLKQPQKAA